MAMPEKGGRQFFLFELICNSLTSSPRAQNLPFREVSSSTCSNVCFCLSFWSYGSWV